jgi:hypothetical protein
MAASTGTSDDSDAYKLLKSSFTEAGLQRAFARTGPFRLSDYRQRTVEYVGGIAALRASTSPRITTHRAVRRTRRMKAAKRSHHGHHAPGRRKAKIKPARSAPDVPPREPNGLNFWFRLKKEFHDLVCTRAQRYADLRKQLARHGSKTQMVIVAGIAGAMAPYVGAPSGVVIAPLVTLCLLAMLKIGKEAFCAGRDFDVPV